MHRGSIAGFASPSAYIGIRLFVLAKIRPAQLFSRAKGPFVSWAKRPAGVSTRPAPPRLAPPRAEVNRLSTGRCVLRSVYICMIPWYVRVFDSTGDRNSSFFGFEKNMEFFILRRPRLKNALLRKLPKKIHIFEETSYLRFPAPKNEELPSSIFGFEKNEPYPIFNLRCSVLKKEALPMFDLRSRRLVRRSDGRWKTRLIRRWGE